MRRSHPSRVLAALALLAVLALPSLAAAQPHPAAPRKAPVQRTAAAGGLAHLWSTWIHLWGQTGAGLDPNGGAPTGNPGGRGASPARDAGAGLDPDGK
jgi:hypothetical protein